MNMIVNWVFSQEGFIVRPVNRGYQWINPPMMANTAPIDNT